MSSQPFQSPGGGSCSRRALSRQLLCSAYADAFVFRTQFYDKRLQIEPR